MKFVVMIFFRHIKLSSGLIGKDVKPGEKFHPQQLFHGQFPGGEAPCLPLVWDSTGPLQAGYVTTKRSRRAWHGSCFAGRGRYSGKIQNLGHCLL